MECEEFFSWTGHHPTIQPRHWLTSVNDDVDVVVDDIKCAVNHRVIKADDQATVQEVVSHQAGCHRRRLTICRLLAYTSLGVVAASRFHKEIVLVQTANSTMESGFITKSKLSRDLSV